jgi:capsular polysaccharide transport system permease protein
MKHEASPSFLGPPVGLPGDRRPLGFAAWPRRLPWLFLILVAAPTLLAACYYLVLAAPLYVSEAEFVVHSQSSSPMGSLGTKLESVGVSLGSESETDAYEVQKYMVSRDAVARLERTLGLRHLLARPEADFLTRFPRPFEGSSFENLFRSYKRFVKVGLDSQTDISVLRVQAFRPQDAQAIANALLDTGEDLINRLNARAMADAVAQAQRQVVEAQARLDQVQTQMAAFRTQQHLVDPDREAAAGLELLGKLQADLMTLRAERAGVAATSPQSPQLPVLDRRIAAYAAQVDAARTSQAGEAGSLAPKVSAFERMTFERKVASDTLEASVAGLETARLDARRQQLFLERVVNPDLPDKAMQPRRWLTVLIVLISCLLLYGVVSLVIAGLREHRQI